MTDDPHAQLQAYRFERRRIAYALRTGHPLPPAKTSFGYGPQAMIGVVLTVLLLVGSAVYGVLRPAPSIGAATVLIDTEAGRVLVVSDGVLHPALNLASALLAAGRPGEAPTVREVTSATVVTLPRGPTIGIANAPQQIPDPADLLENTWTVCDVPHADPARPLDAPQPLRTTVVLGGVTSRPPAAAPILATVDGQSYHILDDGQRRLVPSPTDAALLASIGFRLEDARTISSGLLNAVPEGAAIGWPAVPSAGASVRLGTGRHTVGSVVREDREARDPAYHLILADGIQPVPPEAVDVLRAASGLPVGLTALSPGEVATLPVSTRPIALGEYPAASASVADRDRHPGVCMRWQGGDAQPEVAIYPVLDLPLPAPSLPVPIAPPGANQRQADRAPIDLKTAHAVYVPPQRGLAVRQSPAGSPSAMGTLFLITDQGVAYPVSDEEALASLGFGSESLQAVPAELLSLLHTGPVLDPAAARALVRP